jgi:hypothetical protein
MIRYMLRAYSFGKLFLLRFKQMLTNIGGKTIVTLIPVKCCITDATFKAKKKIGCVLVYVKRVLSYIH